MEPQALAVGRADKFRCQESVTDLGPHFADPALTTGMDRAADISDLSRQCMAEVIG